MVESEVDVYRLNSEDRQQSLRMSLIDNELISMVLTNKVTLERYSVQFGLPQLKEVSEVFNPITTILEGLNILKYTIDSGRIELTEDPQQNLIEVNFYVSLSNKNYPPFHVNLILEKENENEENEDVQILPPTFDYKGDKEVEAKYKNSTENTTEYVEPIIKSDVKAPILELEYVEPILQLHYPDGTTKSTPLPPRIQTVEGKTPNITEEQFKSIQDQMNKSFSGSFSPTIDNNNINRMSSGYSSMTLQQRPFVTPNLSYASPVPSPTLQNNNFNNTTTLNYINQRHKTNDSGIIEKRPRMINTRQTYSNNNNSRSSNRSLSNPSHENFYKFNHIQNQNINQPNLTNNPFQINQSQFDYNNLSYSYERNTQKPSIYNINTMPNLHNFSLNNSQELNFRQVPQSQRQHNDSPNKLSQIQLQQQRLLEVQKRISQIQQQQQNLQAQQKQLNLQQQRIQYQIEQGYIQDNQNNLNHQGVLRQQIQISQKPQISQNQVINNQQLSQSQLLRPIQGFYNNQQMIQQNQPQIRRINSLVNNQLSSYQNSQEIRRIKTQMNNSEKNANPYYKNMQSITFEQQYQEGKNQKNYEIQEYNPQGHYWNNGYQKNEYVWQTQIPGGNNEENLNNEALFFTNDGKIKFRNGLLRGIIHKYIEIEGVVTKIQNLLLKEVKFNLIYKASESGDKANIFHEKCDKLEMSLVLIETYKNIRFGGFTTESWQGNCLKKIDNNAFVFSLETKAIFDIIQNMPAIGCYPKFGPVFFGCQIRVFDDFFINGGTTCLRGLNYNTNRNYELNNGEQKFLIKDIEVYGIETIDIY